jgi:hypothetical protein
MKQRLTLFSLKLLFVVCLLALIPFAGCGKQSGSSSGSSGSSSADAGDGDGSDQPLEVRIDHHGDEIMASSKKYEARDWMKDPNHIFFKEDKKQVSQFIEDFYNAGATQVVIGDTEEHDGATFAGAVLVVLPQDSAARAKVFEINSKVGPFFQEDPVTDKGQKYLLYTPD